MKPGYQTTEFWLTILANVLANFGPVAAAAGPKTAAVIGAATVAVYTASRAYVKANADVSAPVPASSGSDEVLNQK